MGAKGLKPWDGTMEPTTEQLDMFWRWATPRLETCIRHQSKKIRKRRLEELKWKLIEAWIDGDPVHHEAARQAYSTFVKDFFEQYPEDTLRMTSMERAALNPQSLG